jgi:hypothetical protein
MRFLLLTVAACFVLAITGCTTLDTCATVDAAHDAFLAELATDPTAFDAKTIRNERLAYTAAKLACASFVRSNPVTK